MDVYTFAAVKEALTRTFSYFVQRGFQIPAKDVPPQLTNLFMGTCGAGQYNYPGGVPACPTVSLQFIYGEQDVPLFVDLISYIDGFNSWVIDAYLPEGEARQNGHVYPIRIPVITDLTSVCKPCRPLRSAIAYYNASRRSITVIVADKNRRVMGTYQTADGTVATLSLLAFSGTFNLTRRDSNNQIVSSSFSQAQHLIQSSAKICVKNVVSFVEGEVIYDECVDMYSRDDGFFVGVVAPLLNGESPAFDVYVSMTGLGGYVDRFDPLTYLPQDGSQSGDNIITKLIEKMGGPSAMYLADSAKWRQVILSIDPKVRRAETYPEDVGNEAITPPPTNSSDAEAVVALLAHEFVHNIQLTVGSISPLFDGLVPVEATATGLESDEKLLGSNVLRAGARSWQAATALTAWVRGGLQLMENPPGARGYGMGIFWRYLATSLDPNYQSYRRMMDILSSETVGALVANLDQPYLPGGVINLAASNLAFDQALGELYETDLATVFENFSIALCFLRNNTSIPEIYRVKYPYWLYNSEYVGFEKLQVSQALVFEDLFGIPDFTGPTNWWEVYQDNGIIPESWVPAPFLPVEGVGENFTPLLPATVTAELYDMSLLMYEIPAATTTIDVEVFSGDWSISAVYFSSDGTAVGDFILDGPHRLGSSDSLQLDISRFPEDGGIVRLVCVNVTLTDYGSVENNIYSEPILSGKITISRQ